VCTIHGGDINIYPHWNTPTRIVTQRAIKNADALIAVSTDLEKKTLALGVSKHPIRVVPNGVDLQQFIPTDKKQARSELGLPQDKKILVYVSRLDKAKGLSYLLSAFKLLLKREKTCLLVLVGDGPYKRHLIQEVTALNLQDKVRFAGLRPHQVIAK